MKKLFSLLCLLILSAVSVVQAAAPTLNNMSFTWDEMSSATLLKTSGSRVCYIYKFQRSGSTYPQLWLTVNFENSKGMLVGGTLYPAAVTYSTYGNSEDPDLSSYDLLAGFQHYYSSTIYNNTTCLITSSSSGYQNFGGDAVLTVTAGAGGKPYITLEAGTIYYNGTSCSSRESYKSYSFTITIGSPAADGTISAVASPTEGGSASVSPSGYQAGGSNVSLSATPNSGFAFLCWQDAGGNTISTTANTSVSVNGTATYTAVFAPARTLTVQVANNQSSYGTVSGGGTYAQGATVTISATANSGYQFSQWNDGNTDSQRTITISSDNSENTYTAYFEEYTSHLSIVTCSSGADIEAHFDYSNITVTYNKKTTYFLASNTQYGHLINVTADKTNKIDLKFASPSNNTETYSGGDCSLSNAPTPGTYGLYKTTKESNGWVINYGSGQKGAVVVYNTSGGSTNQYSTIKYNSTTYKLRMGTVTVSRNNVGGIFIEANSVQNYDQNKSIYFTLGNRSENTVNLGTGTMTASGSNLTFNASTTDNNGRNYAAKIKIKQNTTGSVAQTNFDLNQSSFLYQDSYIEEIKSITGTLSKSGNTYTLSLKIRDCSENLYIVTMSAPAPVYNITFKNADGTTLKKSDGTTDAVYSVAYGETPAYDGAPPTKTADSEYTYTFNDWDNEIVAATEDATYTATYTQTKVKYTLAWDFAGGATTSETGDYTNGLTDWGTAITKPADPTKSGYTFNGWDANNDGTADKVAATMPTSDVTYKALWSAASPNITLCEDCNDAHYNTFKATYGGSAGVGVNVTYNRQFAEGRWSTMCLPFSLDLATMIANKMYGRVYEFKYATGNANTNSGVNLYFSNAKSIEAGKCYIVNANSALETKSKTPFVFSGVTIDLTNDKVATLTSVGDYNKLPGYKSEGTIELVGTLRNGTLQGSATGNTYMGLKSNKIYYPNTGTGSTIWAYRGIFRSTSALNVEKMRIIVDGEDRGEIRIEDGDMILDAGGDDRVPSRKFIENGVLYIEREGVVYDAQGKRVEN